MVMIFYIWKLLQVSVLFCVIPLLLQLPVHVNKEFSYSVMGHLNNEWANTDFKFCLSV